MGSRRAVLVLDRWEPRRGGLEAYASDLAEALRDAGVETVLLTGEVRGPVPSGVEVRRVGGRGPDFDLAADRELEAFRGARVVSFRHPGPRADMFAALGGLFIAALEARRGFEVRPLRDLRGLARRLSRHTRFRLEREAAFFGAGRGRVLLAPSPGVEEAARRFFPGFEGRTVVTGLPVDRERFSVPDSGERRRARAALGIPDEARICCFLGHDSVRKGLPSAIAVCRRLRARRIDARLIVRGRARPFPTPKVLRLRSEGALRLLGEGDPLPLYHAADLCLHPSREDSFALVVAEALSCGLPIVTARTAGVSAWIRSPRVGRVVADPADLEALDRAALLSLAEGELASSRRLERREAVADCGRELHFRKVLGILGFSAEPSGSPASPSGSSSSRGFPPTK